MSLIAIKIKKYEVTFRSKTKQGKGTKKTKELQLFSLLSADGADT